MLKYIPNTLTIIRLLLIPFIVINIFTGNYISAFIFFTLSGITDIADGFIARKYNVISSIGKLLDPLADKLTQIFTLTSLAYTKIIPIWILIIVLIKEFTMIIGASFLYGKDVVVYSKWYGKLATVLFFFAIILSLLLKQFNITGFFKNLDAFMYCLALFTTLFALIMYVRYLNNNGFIDKEELKKEVSAKNNTNKTKI